jgi:branched-chain amino acid transport system substrate-binding protein
MMIWTSIGSQTALGIKAIASEFKVPVISGGGIDALGKPADPWFFKMAPGASDFVKGLVEYAQQRGITSIATLNSTDAFGQSEAEALKGLARKANIKLVAAETFGTADTNFIPQLVRINQAKPGFFYNGSNGASSILIFKQIKQLNFNLSMAVSLTAINAAFYKGIGGRENANGVLSIVPLGAVAEQVGGEVARLYAECEKALSKPPLLFHTWGWDTGLVAEHALKRSDGTRPAIRDALDQIRDLPAINGPLTYTPENHIGQDTRGLTLAKLEDGKWAIVR